MGLEEDFTAAAAEATASIPESAANDDRVALYGLYKQATVGDCTTARPNIFDQKGRYKWDAWEAKKGLSQEDAKAAYIKLVADLKAKYA
eukprot:CAMPEP_0119116396 /NCGR_PEP_ID=MMETSP1180-20130426/52258_1 /TAXON_ID=3052 ORGANISM="Chlamydomonas cf sp, Strain CCMP681" /NCGR_SAMPLE_ID=MMETSP1180 /ASSEMBLY_ACC=CAM_ASM_000741 /LENGTH=88 /DNA_ID=CAMNT_0007105535 /DNA_START=38 /DNA_END=304 /DNA_ORIENTATION=-